MKKYLLTGFLCLSFSVPIMAQTKSYMAWCERQEAVAEHEFLLQILKHNPTPESYTIITNLVRNYKTGYFKNGDMEIYVRAHYLYVNFGYGVKFEIYRRKGECKVYG